MAQRVIISNGIEYLISDGQSDTGTVGVGGTLDVGDGGNAIDISVTGSETILSGGSDAAAVVLNGGVQTVQSGGSASGATVDSGGSQIVQSSGIADATVVTGGVQTVPGGRCRNRHYDQQRDPDCRVRWRCQQHGDFRRHAERPIRRHVVGRHRLLPAPAPCRSTAPRCRRRRFRLRQYEPNDRPYRTPL